MDLRDYYDNHWTHVPEGGVDYSRLRMVLDVLEPGEKVLDSGCGPGFLAALLAENGVDVVGTDVSAVGPERTRARGVEAWQVDLDTEPLPFRDGEFDAVIANSNLEHLFFIHRHIAELVRCVRPGGKFIWLVPNIGHWRYRLWLLARALSVRPEQPDRRVPHPLHDRVRGARSCSGRPGSSRSGCAATPAPGCGASIRAGSSTA